MSLVAAVFGDYQQMQWGSSTPSDYDMYSGRQSPPSHTVRTGTPSSSDEGGTKRRGGWTLWSEWSVCSRPCDGGVSRQLRRCSSRDGCKGEPQRYKICNMQPCQENQDFRARQCSAYDQVPYEGALLTWAPHYEETEPCALTCRGKSQSHPQDGPQPMSEENEDETVVVAQLASKVQDGTRCRPGSLDMCINGKCQRVGCDLRIGSNRRVDECGVCGGDGSSCARPLYQWETAPMSLCSVTCGGGYRMARPVCRNRISGTDVEEQLCNASQRPEPAVQQCNMHPCPPKWSVGDWSSCSASCGGGTRSRRVECGAKGVNGTFRLANEEACAGHRPRHLEPCAETQCPQWIPGQWSGCSVSCGGGVRVRGVQCVGGDSDGESGEPPCPASSRPPSQLPCSTGIVCPTYYPEHEENDDIEDLIPGVVYHTQPLIQPYPPPQAKAEKLIGEQVAQSEATFIKDADWGPCSVTCGEGIRKREVHCKIFLEFSRTIAKLPDYKCAGPKPKEETERCVMEPCSMAYGASYSDSNSPSLYPGDIYNRPSGFGDPSIRVGAGVQGKTYSWKEQGYTHCSASCLGGVQELIVNCVRDDTQKIASPYMCPPESKPENRIRTCNDHPCPPRWNYSEFSQCTKSCGIGIQTREVSCIHEVTRSGGNTVIVPHSMCPQPTPPDRQYCNVLDCPVRWHTTQWSKCTKPCGGGVKERKVECKQVMAQSHVVERPESMCPSNKPPSTKPCHTKGCVQDTSTPTIITSDTTYIQLDPKKKQVTLKIGGSAKVFYGTQVKIKCPVKKFNRTKILWAKDRIYLTKSKKYAISKKGALRIQELRLQDAGKYSCEAGKSVADLNLTVLPRPGEFPSSEEIERQKASPPDDPNDSFDRNDARYRPFVGSEDQSHEQRPGTDQSSIFKQRERNREKQREREREIQREKERERQMQTTSQMPMRYHPQPDDDYSDKDIGSGHHEEDAIPSQMPVAGDIKETGQTSSAARPMPHFLRLISNLQTFSNSRGHRMISDVNVITENRSEDTSGASTSSNTMRHFDQTSGRDSDFTTDSDFDEDSNTTPEDWYMASHEAGLKFRKSLETGEGSTANQGNLHNYDIALDGGFRKSTVHNGNGIQEDSNSVFTDQERVTTANEKMGGFRLSTISDEDSLGSITVLGKGKAENIRFEWAITDWSKCSITCGGGGFQMRAAHCMVRLDNTTQDVESTLCEDAGLESPPTIQKCGLGVCPTWLAKDWSSCSTARCFDWNTAMQRRVVECVGSERVGVPPSLCPQEQRPPHRQECYNDKCKGVWKTDHWSECGGPCGQQGARYRILRCVWFGTRRPAGSACRHRPRPAVVRPCNTTPCQHNQKAECKDSSKFCQNVRAMNMCRVQRYQLQCCQSCKKH